jgi:monooxygenase
MSATPGQPAAGGPVTGPRHVDVLIVGAGLSGIGAACRLETEAPGTSYAIIEARGASGGTWDLFRYPGVRSDSDMHTLGYPFRPWRQPEAIASGADILRYLRETAAVYGVDGQISYHRRVTQAHWSTPEARWTVQTEDTGTEDTGTGARAEWTCGLLYLCAGYYSYDQGYTPDWPGQADFAGRIVHPQAWPEDLDVAGQRVIVIGSGATAVTLVPALTQGGAQVTMVQRSPSYLLSLPSRDPLAELLHRVLPARRAHDAVRWKNARVGTLLYNLCQAHPARARAVLRRGVRRRLPAGYDVDTHFSPAYGPWDQRLCLVPDDDFFRAISAGRAAVVTDHIDRFTRDGIALRSGAELGADLIVTATGLNVRALGGIELTVDGEPVRVPERVAYQAMMLDGVPNMVFAIGYTNASWTLKVDLVAEWVIRLLRYMSSRGYATVTPRLPADGLRTSSIIEMTSGYFARARASLPLQGDRAPWRLRQHYFRDAAAFREPIRENELEFRPVDALPASAR